MIANATQDNFVEYDDHKIGHEAHFTVPATIGPDDGRHIFSYLGTFLTYITPRDVGKANVLISCFILRIEGFGYIHINIFVVCFPPFARS